MSNKIIKQKPVIQEKEVHWKAKCLYMFAGIAAAYGLAFLMLGKNDGVIFMQWHIYMMLMLGISMPMSRMLFKNCDSLLPFGKILGIIIPGFIMWVIGILLDVPFSRTNALLVIVLYAVINSIIAYKQKMTLKDWRSGLAACFKFEVAFFFVFLFWVYLIGFNPAAYGTEKFMDYAFMQKMITTTKLPPDDVWFAGKVINYYYGGQYYAAFVAKTMIGGISKTEYSYNMMRALIPAIMFAGVYGIADEMIKNRAKKKNVDFSKTKNWACIQFFAVLSAVLAVFAGNGHYIIYGMLKPFINDTVASVSYTWHQNINVDSSSYWFPDATRYIGYNPDVPTDKTIHEFPCYSFVLGDLHAHMINIMIVITIIALLYSFVKNRKLTREKSKLYKCFCYPQIYVLGLLWGLCNFTNYWDYIIYIVVIAITVLFTNIMADGKMRTALKNFTIHLAIVIIIGMLAALPFTMNFESVFKGVGIAQNHSKLYQLAVLWGIPVTASIAFLVMFFATLIKRSKKDGLKNSISAISAEDILVFILSCCAIGLVVMPELVYVKDIYEGTNARANTMFKLTYQAFIMFTVCSGYILYLLTEKRVKTIAQVVKKASKEHSLQNVSWKCILGYVLIALNLMTVLYFFKASSSWFKNWMTASERTGIYALNYLDTDDFAAEKDALLWLKDKVENDNETAAVAEAPGDSYTAYERVSVITGLSTPAGWTVHEWLWRDSYDGISNRQSDVDLVYDEDEDTAKEMIKKYNIKYIYFGLREEEKYGKIAKYNVKKLGKVIYEDDAALIVKAE